MLTLMIDKKNLIFSGRKSLFKQSTDSSLHMKKTWVYKIYLLKMLSVCH